ncbi:MAG: hypothetical protein ACXW08_15290 [Solirubrobacteraceae bacterium]
MLFRRSSRRRSDVLRRCPMCRSDLACPIEWAPSDDEHWSIDLRCGDCGHAWDVIIDNTRAARYDVELDGDMAEIKRSLQHLDLARMAVEVEAFAAALSNDLIEPADFAV